MTNKKISAAVDFKVVWNLVSSQLANDPSANAVFSDSITASSFVFYKEGVFVIEAASADHKKSLQDFTDTLILPVLQSLLGHEVDFLVRVKSSEPALVTEEQEIFSFPQEVPVSDDDSSNVDPSLLFSSFVIGKNNNMAHSAAVDFSEGVKLNQLKINPLYIFGPSGVGKTHLLQAIGNSVKRDKKKRVSYISAKDFIEGYTSSFKKEGSGGPDAFLKSFQDLDLLLIDDIQDFSEKEGTQQAFFTVFEWLIKNKRGVAIISDVIPDNLASFHGRLKSRFKSSLYFGIDISDFDSRVSFIKYIVDKNASRLKEDNIQISESNITQLARLLKTNNREIIGSLEKLFYYCFVNNTNPSEEIIDTLFLSYKKEEKKNTVPYITKVCAKYFDVSEEDLRGSCKIPKISTARHVTMFLCTNLTDSTKSEIGKYFKKDWTSVINAEKSVKKKIKEGKISNKQIEEITKKIR